MEDLVFLLSASLILYKSGKKSSVLPIGDTGCTIQFFSRPVLFDKTQTEKGDILLYGEQEEKKITYGILCAKLHERLEMEEAKELLQTYMQRLQSPFKALYAVGIEAYPEWETSDGVASIVDYWQDGAGLDWKVKGYTNGQTIAVLYIKNINEASVERQDQFLDSFCFGDS